jgi:hypothetical protein
LISAVLGLIPRRTSDLSLFYSIHAGYGAHKTFYPMGAMGKQAGTWSLTGSYVSPPLEAEVEISKEFHFTVKPVNLTLSMEYGLLNASEGTSLTKDFGLAGIHMGELQY